MRTALKRAAMVALLTACGAVHAADWNHAQNIQNGVKQFLAAYKGGGMVGVRAAVDTCYQATQKLPKKSDQKLKKLESCMSTDLAARHTDSVIAEQLGYPPNDYFEPDTISKRLNHLAEWFPDFKQRSQVVSGLSATVVKELNQLNQ